MGIRVNTGTVSKKAATELLSGKRSEALAYNVLAETSGDAANSAGMALTSAELQKFLESATTTAQAPAAVQTEGPAFAEPTPIAGEFRVNTFTTGSQDYSAVTALDGGGFLVTWASSDQDGSGYGIYGQRYTATGIASGSEFRINTFTIGEQAYASASALIGGGFVVTWSSFNQDGSGYGIYGQRYTAGGVQDGGEFRISTATGNNQIYSSVTTLNDGGFVVTWTSNFQDGSGDGIYGQRYTSAGVAAGVEFRVNTYTPDSQYFAAVAALDNGGFVVTWTSSSQDGSSEGVYAQRYTSAGVADGSEFRVNTYTSNTQAYSSVAGLDGGGFVVTWSDVIQDGSGFGIYGQRYTAAGVTDGGEFRINTNTNSEQFFSSVTALNGGGFMVTWSSLSQDGDSWGIYGQRYTASGIADGGEFRVSETTVGDQFQDLVPLQGVTQLADGSLVATWFGNGIGDGAGVFARRFSLAAANTAPAGTDATLTITEDTARVLTVADFGFTDADGHALLSVGITTLPAAGTIRLNGTAVTAGTFVTAADINAGLLVYTPGSNGNGAGYSSFTFQVRDNGGGTDTDLSPNTITFDVTSVNDAPTFSAAAALTRVSGLSNGGNANSAIRFEAADISADGTKVVFSSNATNLVAGDTNGATDIFLKDLTTGAVTRVSTSASGIEGNGVSNDAMLSPDGTKVIFTSTASNLVAGDTNGASDVFVKTLATGAIERISVSASGFTLNNGGINGIFSPDSEKVAFQANNQIYVKTLSTGVLQLVSIDALGNAGNSASAAVVFSPDGTKIAFTSSATNLVAGDTNGQQDIFVKDLVTGVVTLVSVATDGSQATGGSFEPSFSPDGTKIVFRSFANNLSAADGDGTFDIFVRDLVANTTTLVSADASGIGANGGSQNLTTRAFSPDGSTVYFASSATNLVAGTFGVVSIFGKNLATGAVTLISVGENGTPALSNNFDAITSATGAVLFRTDFRLVAGDTDSFYDHYLINPGNLPPTYRENGAALTVIGTVNVADVDSATYAGGIFSASITNNSAAGDQLTLTSSGGATGINVVGNSVQFNGVEIGILTASATTLSVALDSDATDASVEALTEAVRFASTSENPGSATRTVTFTLVDGGGTANGGTDTASFTRSVAVSSVNDAPSGTDAIISGTEDVARTLNATDFGFTDTDGNTLFSVVISTLPTAGTLRLNGNAVTVGQAITVGQLNDNLLVYTPAANANGDGVAALTFRVRDNGGTANGGVDTDVSPNTLTFNVTAVNDAPVSSGFDNITFVEDNPNAVTLDTGFDQTLTDVDSPDFDGGTLSFRVSANHVPTEDRLTFLTGGSSFLAVSSNTISYQGVTFATFNPGGVGVDRSFTFNANATVEAVRTLMRNLAYRNDNQANPSTVVRTIEYTLTDGDGGTQILSSTVSVTPVDDAPTAVADSATTPENATVIVNVTGNDTDVDGGPRTVTQINGVAATVGTAITLASGATATNNGDGTITYNPNGAFDSLPGAGSGASNLSAPDSFTYTLNGGSSATVSLTVTGVDSNDTLNGTAGNDTLDGGTGNDVINGYAGSDVIIGGANGDTLTGGAGNDTFVYQNVTDSNSTERDGIQDFALGDIIDVTALDANANVAGNQDFRLIGTTAFSGTAGELRYENISLGGPIYLVQGDVNGDGVSDFEVVLVNTENRAFTAADFLGATSNVAPVAVDDSLTATEDTPVIYTAAQLLGNDTDGNSDPLTIASVTAISGGTVVLNGDGTVTFTPNINFNGNAVFDYAVSDGQGGSDIGRATVAVAAVPDAPLIANLQGDTASFTEGGTLFSAPLDVGLNALVSDADSSDFNGGSLNVTVSGGVASEDFIYFNNSNPAFGLSFSGNTISQGGVAFATFNSPGSSRTFTFLTNGSATAARVEQLVRSLSYFNNNGYNPSEGAHTVTYTLTDGSGGTSVTTSTVNVIGINTAPSLDLNAGTAGINDTNVHSEGSFASGIGTAIAISDDGGSLVRATVTITDAIAGDVLTVNLPLPSGISVDPASTATTLILVGNASTSAFATALGQVAYSSTSDNPTAGGTDTSRSITVVVNDGVADSAPATMTMTVLAVNDAPVVNFAFTAPVIDQSALDLSSGHNISSFVQSNNFTVSGGTTLNRFTVFLAESAVATAGVFEGFGGTLSFAIYRDNGSGLPGTLLFTGADAAPVATDTGFDLGGRDLFQFVVNVGGITLGSGSYWIALHEGAWLSPSDGTEIFWSRSANDTNNNMRANTSSVTAPNGTFATFVPGLAFSLNGAPAAIEQTALDLKGKITVADPDAGSSIVTATLSVDYGVLKINVGTSGATIVSGSGTGTIVLSGTIAQLNALLNTDATSAIRYTANTDTPPASTNLTVSVNDGGSFGSGGAQIGGATQTIAIIAVNDVPVVDLNGAAAGVDTTGSYTEGVAPIRPLMNLAITDVDSGTLSGATVTIATGFVAGDLLRLAGGFNGTTSSGISYSYNNATGVLSLTGVASLADYQSVLAALSFKSNSDDPGTARDITVVVNDGTTNSIAAHVLITVSPVNDAPVNIVPIGQTTTSGVTIVFSAANGNALSVGDADAGSGLTRVRLSAEHGTLTLGSTVGVTVTGDGTGVVKITGTLTAINAALNGLSYHNAEGYIGADALTITTNDTGNTGSGGPLTDTDSVAITVDPGITQAASIDKLFADDQGGDISAAFGSNHHSGGSAGGLVGHFYPVAPIDDTILGSAFLV